LHIQTDFPGGNACAIDVRQTADRDIVYFSADPRGGTEALWFYFRVVECSERPVELVLSNLDTCLGGGSEQWGNVRPVIREAGSTWQHLPNARSTRSPTGAAKRPGPLRLATIPLNARCVSPMA